MDGSLASIFMNSAAEEPPLCVDHEWSALDTQCPAELQYKLMCTAMELQRAKAAAKEEEKVQETKLHHLQELLTIIRRERDDARNECKQLRERLSQQSSSSADSPCSFMRSSPASSPWSLQELEEHLNNDNFCDFSKGSSSLELQQTLQCFSQSYNGDDADGLQALFSSDPTCESILDSSDEPFSLNMLEDGTPLSADPSLNVAKLEQSEEAMQGESESIQSARSLSRQSSANSSSASVQLFQQTHSSINLSDAVGSLLPLVKAEGLGGGIDAPVPVHMAVVASSTTKALPLSGDVPVSSSMSPPPRVSNTARRSPSPLNVSPSDKQANATTVRQVHLPEPPEADPQVMLSSLPEKGRLLQAVMQAGPLLQTLLLAGPLPQWRHPPPPLSTGDIPNVSMVPSNNLILPYPHASMVPGHIKYVSPTTAAASPAATRVRAANADSCARPKKLRKLSPATPHQSQLMHMWSVEGRMPVGVVPYPPTIY